MSFLKTLTELNEEFPSFLEKGNLIKSMYPKLYDNLTNSWGYQNNTVIDSISNAMDRQYDLSAYDNPYRGPSTLAQLGTFLKNSDTSTPFPSDKLNSILNIADNAKGHNNLEQLYKFLQQHYGTETSLPALESAKTFFPDLFEFQKYNEA